MKKNKIKNTGLEVTELCFGTSSLGSMPDTYGYEVPEERAQDTLKRFFQGPVNLLDTSRNYAMGESENRIGKARIPRIYLSMINFSIELIHDKMCINSIQIIIQMKMTLAKRVSKLEIVVT